MKLTWQDVGLAVGKFAPLVGGIVGGPIGAGVGEVGSMIARALGCDATPDAVMAAVQKDPEAGVKLAKIEADEKVRLAQIASDQAVQRHHDAVADRGSARDLKIKTGSKMPEWLTALTIAVLIGAGAVIAGGNDKLFASTVAVSFATMLMKDIGMMVRKVYTYWFGSDDDEDDGESSAVATKK